MKGPPRPVGQTRRRATGQTPTNWRISCGFAANPSLETQGIRQSTSSGGHGRLQVRDHEPVPHLDRSVREPSDVSAGILLH